MPAFATNPFDRLLNTVLLIEYKKYTKLNKIIEYVDLPSSSPSKIFCCLQSNSKNVLLQHMELLLLLIFFHIKLLWRWKLEASALPSLFVPLKCFLNLSQSQRLESTLQLCHSLFGKFLNSYSFLEKLKQTFFPLASVNSVSQITTNDTVTLLEASYYSRMNKHGYGDCSAVSSCHSSYHSFLIDVAYLELSFIRFLSG